MDVLGDSIFWRKILNSMRQKGEGGGLAEIADANDGLREGKIAV